MYKTIPGFESLTAQQVFDMSAKHLLTQMKQSKKGNFCVYSGEGGLKCAAGIFLTEEGAKECDKFGEEDAEGSGWAALLRATMVPPQNAELIECLQDIHDDRNGPSEWRYKLICLANEYSLDASVCQ